MNVLVLKIREMCMETGGQYAEQLLDCTTALPAIKPKVKGSLNRLPPAALPAVLNFIFHTRLGHKIKKIFFKKFKKQKARFLC